MSIGHVRVHWSCPCARKRFGLCAPCLSVARELISSVAEGQPAARPQRTVVPGQALCSLARSAQGVQPGRRGRGTLCEGWAGRGAIGHGALSAACSLCFQGQSYFQSVLFSTSHASVHVFSSHVGLRTHDGERSPALQEVPVGEPAVSRGLERVVACVHACACWWGGRRPAESALPQRRSHVRVLGQSHWVPGK